MIATETKHMKSGDIFWFEFNSELIFDLIIFNDGITCLLYRYSNSTNDLNDCTEQLHMVRLNVEKEPKMFYLSRIN